MIIGARSQQGGGRAKGADGYDQLSKLGRVHRLLHNKIYILK